MIELRCQYCDRYIPLEIVDTTITRVRCADRKCRKMNAIKIVTPNSSLEQIHYRFKDTQNAKVTTSEARITKAHDKLKTKLEDAEKYIGQLEGILDGQN